MGEMLERMARAMCEADPTAPDPDAPIYMGMKPAKAWQARVSIAKAILQAMRGPTPRMIELFCSLPPDDDTESHCADIARLAGVVWDGMLDAALKEAA